MKAKKFLVFGICLIFASCMLLVCGNNKNGADNSSSTNGTNGSTGNNVGTDIEDGVEDAGDAIGDAVEDVGDAVGDIVTGRFDNYDDAHDYFMKQFQGNNNRGNYEIRNEHKELTEYQDGHKGYRFELYDTSSGEGSRVDEYYVDSESGKIYQKDDTTGDMNEYNLKNQ